MIKQASNKARSVAIVCEKKGHTLRYRETVLGKVLLEVKLFEEKK